MIKITPIIFTLFIYQSVNSQRHLGNEMTNIVPPSPQSEQMTTYGNQPLNEYKGMAQISIPITGIKEKDLFNNIELRYSKLGVKVNDVPNNVGASWLLDMGGVITRTIYDFPDEMRIPAKRLIFENLYGINTLTQSPNGSANAALLNSYVKDATLDNEVDVFNISVNGLTGSFYLDKDLNPVLLADTHQFKIQTVGDFKTTHAFILTTNEGIKYYFGGSTAIERTFVRDSPELGGYTSFYLTKIQNVQGSELNFEYKNNGPTSTPISETEYKTIRTQTFQDCENPTRSLGFNKTYSGFVLKVNDSRVLTAIKGEQSSIKINYDPADVDKILSIEVFNRNKKNKEFEFIYIDSTPKKRFFLSNIKIYDVVNDARIYNNEYAFEYNDPLRIPARMARATDLYGYYNGNSGPTLVPNLNLLIGDGTQTDFPGLAGLADRRSNFEYAVKGTLKSITYPTKGKTLYEYEGLGQKSIVYGSQGAMLDADEIPANIENTSFLNGNEIMDDKISVTLYISQHMVSGPPANYTANFKILDAVTNEVLKDQNLLLPKPIFGQEGPSQKTVVFDFATVKNRQYKFVMKLLRTNYHDIGDYLVVYKNKYKEVNNVGLRLKRISDFDGVNTTNIKRLYYSSFDDINKPDLLPDNLYQIGGYTTYIYDIAGCSNGNGTPLFYPKAIQQSILSSQNSNDYFDQSPSFPVVTISYGGDNFEKGGEEKRFINGVFDGTDGFYAPPPPATGTTFFGDASDLSIITGSAVKDFNRNVLYEDYNGKLIENRVFSSLNNGKAYMKQKTVFNYDFIETKTVYNLMGKSVYEQFFFGAGEDPNNLVTNLALFYLPRKSYSVPLNNKTETLYFENVPVDTDDDSSYKKSTTTTNYFYNNPLHYQVTQQKTTYPDNTVSTSDFAYAHEKGNQRLINANMIGVPLETETKENGKLVNKSETKYDSPIHLLPTSALSFDLQNPATGSTELTYDQYDSKGNLQQYTTKNGLSTTIIWGYNKTQPIAKIEGAKLSDISQSLIDNVVNASDNDAQLGTDASELSLITALDTFRNNSALSGYQISTYTYNPLIGVTSITSSSGIREIYTYDTANRLKEVKQLDKYNDGAPVYKIVKEYQYNYKN
ncbi:hypothetical protein [Chryseobacterium sp. JM1]|uniref:hypothetical protein n=1 Tax=Chryseobacterium sp. JM1 TaxID=1233950 RepID=UPI0004E7490F|nr:hypothetical protein [Chryseobacterium sp. JM1]KFF15714.1 hypothetical protein IW22_23610 [Chryseobacterium sp. JM1]